MADALTKLLKELQKVKQAAIAKGVMPVAVTAQTAVAEQVDDNDKPASNPRSVVISSVGGYLEALKKLPRQLLEARYLKDMGVECPAAPRDWIIEKMARKFQDEQYVLLEGKIPDSVLRNDRIFNMQKPRLAAEDEDPDDSDEPDRETRRFDPTMRAKAKCPNPFSRGKAMLMFALIEQQPNGIQYNGLVLMLKTMWDCAQAIAEKKAQKAFTKWVDEGLVELV